VDRDAKTLTNYLYQPKNGAEDTEISSTSLAKAFTMQSTVKKAKTQTKFDYSKRPSLSELDDTTKLYKEIISGKQVVDRVAKLLQLKEDSKRKK